jgi:transposase
MVFEHQHEYPSQWKAIESIAQKLDINRETLRVWVRRAEVDDGRRPGLTTDERARIRELEREVKELRRANEILKAASAFFGGSSTASPSADRVHRRASRDLRGRADLQGVARARLWDRPEHLLDSEGAPTLEARLARRGAHG